MPGLFDYEFQLAKIKSKNPPLQRLSGLIDWEMFRGVIEEALKRFTFFHSQLSQLIAPAKPRSIHLLYHDEKKGGRLRFLGPIPLVRQMMVIAILSLVGLFAMGLSPQVDGDPKKFSLFTNDGVSLLFNQLFLLFAAGIGASFAALFQANRYLKEGTFDPIYETSYWIRFVLGLLAGVIIALLVPIEKGDIPGRELDLQGFGKPILALLGGFSADVVYRVLTKLTEAVESLVRGDVKGMAATKERELRAKVNEQAVQKRLALAASLTKLHQKAGGLEHEEIRKEIERLQSELILPGSYGRGGEVQ